MTAPRLREERISKLLGALQIGIHRERIGRRIQSNGCGQLIELRLTHAITPPAATQPLRGIQLRMNASRSALMVLASVVHIPCGKPLYVLSVPFFTSLADSGPASAYGTI